MSRNRARGLLTAILCFVPAVQSQIFITESFEDVNLAIPDDNLSGASDTQSISSSAGPILDVNVSFTLTAGPSGAFNGDYYAYLSHDSGLAILLNRPGRAAANPVGYDDSGFQDVTLDDEAANGDIHNYRLTFTGSPVTGTWEPDARNTPPSSALDTDPRTAFLTEFDGLSPNGEWTLFIADVGAGGSATLESWGLEITAIPEPVTAIPAAAGLLMIGMVYRFHRRRAASDEDSFHQLRKP